VLCSSAVSAAESADTRQRRVVFIVSKDDLVSIEDTQASVPAMMPFEVTGWIDGTTIDNDEMADQISSVLHDLAPSYVVIGRHVDISGPVEHELALLHRSGVRVRSVISFYAEFFGRVPPNELRKEMLFVDVGDLHRRLYFRAKRVIDVTVAVPLLIVTAVLSLVLVIANIFGNRGPLLYRQPRVGLHGEEITILKFRSMRPARKASDDTKEWTIEADSRVTPIGRMLRATHLDELPQSINVLRGELSLIGPRPEQPHYVEVLSQQIESYDTRHLVRPGITGWAQVNADYASSVEASLEKMNYDLFYVMNQSLSLDFRIFCRTVRSLTFDFRKGR
jgi:lipopolysaccharide/colanic/teichoic acid biosynthesis glycosyltransferase